MTKICCVYSDIVIFKNKVQFKKCIYFFKDNLKIWERVRKTFNSKAFNSNGLTLVPGAKP